MTVPRGLHRCTLLLAALPILGGSTVSMVVPVSLQVPLLANVLRFDRAIRDRDADEIVILVAYQSSFGPSREFRDEVLEYTKAREPDVIHGKQLRWEFLDLASLNTLAEECISRRASVLYLGPLRAVDIGQLAAVAAGAGALTVSGLREHVLQGVAVGFDVKGERPSILINLRAAKAAGASFGSQLLQVAELVGR
jgi:hypothetical protein